MNGSHTIQFAFERSLGDRSDASIVVRTYDLTIWMSQAEVARMKDAKPPEEMLYISNSFHRLNDYMQSACIPQPRPPHEVQDAHCIVP